MQAENGAGDRPSDFERAWGAGFANEPHPVFARIEPWAGTVEPGWDVNFLGVKTRVAYFSLFGRLADYSERREVTTSLPVQNEDYFEWIDLLEAVFNADTTFRMIELGAGWGKWLANGIAAARSARKDYEVVGVEAEPKHFDWMREHLRDNGVDLEKARLIEAAVAAHDGDVWFHVGAAADWYGQRIEEAPPTDASVGIRDRLSRLLRREASGRDSRYLTRVRSVSLRSLLAGDAVFDLIDSDVQGSEADVFEAAGERLNDVVRRVHIGTHSDENEARLRQLFQGLGWECVNEFANGRENDTRYGAMHFEDGVQSWLNPRLV